MGQGSRYKVQTEDCAFREGGAGSTLSQSHAKKYFLGTHHTEGKVFGFILTDKNV